MDITVTTKDLVSSPNLGWGSWEPLGGSPNTRTGTGSWLFSSVIPSTPENVTRSPSQKRWPWLSSAPMHVTTPGLP